MKKIYKLFTYFVFISLIFINVFIFINGIRLSQKITFYEINTQKFSKKADPYFLENLRFALKK